MSNTQGRWSSQKKAELVLRLLRGDSVDSVSREHSVAVETLTRWRDDFIEAGIAGLKGRTLESVRIAALEKKIGQQAMELELHEKKAKFIGTKGGRSFK